MPGIPNARFSPLDDPAPIVREGLASVERECGCPITELPETMPPAHFLAVSGGGEDGAFGAGLLVGWTEHGDRPEFKLVTGISTGALTAPFAFLGPDYDDELRAIYTTTGRDDVFRERDFTAAMFDDAMGDTAPLYETVSRYADEALLEAIAAEYGRGRLLIVGTTDLDARRAVLWNMTAIAASDAPNRLDLFRRILLASAAIPGAFPPVMIDVELDGQTYQEMHVDGGAMAQVIVYPTVLHLREVEARVRATRERRLYLIRNARLDPEWQAVERRTYDIATRAISSLIQTQGVGDLYQIYAIAERDGVEYNLASVPTTFKTPLKEPFDLAYMQELFDIGYELGRQGYDWQKAPPGFETTSRRGD